MGIFPGRLSNYLFDVHVAPWMFVQRELMKEQLNIINQSPGFKF